MNTAGTGCGVKNMSVIHDVLQNLDVKHAALTSTPSSLNAAPLPGRLGLWLGISLSLLFNLLLLGYLFWPINAPVPELPPEVFSLPNPVSAQAAANIAQQNTTTEISPATISPAVIGAEPINKIADIQPAAVPAPVPSTPVVNTQKTPAAPAARQAAAVQIEKTDSSKAMEKVLESVNNGAPLSPAKASLALDINEHPVVRARLLMASDPDQVLPYLQRAVPDFMQDSDLLSIAAQSEQKQARHNTALKFYQQLIHLQPADARWRAGLAISLDAMGNQRDALRLYELAIGMGNLPPALANFVQKRINVIKA